ncbi:MAG: LysR family transcriptional regulator [Pseudomonadota bacterium]
MPLRTNAAPKRGAPPARAGAAERDPRSPTLTWDDLRVALAVGRAGSLARAAEVLSVDPATVSRRIAALEAALGAIVFTRTKAGMIATDAGHAVIARAMEIEHRTMLIEEEVAASRTAKGVVRVAGGMWTIARLAAVGVPLMQRDYPELCLRLISCRPPVDLPSGLPTVSLWFEATPRDNEFSITLGEAPYGIYARADRDPSTLPLLSHRNEDGPARAPDRWAIVQSDHSETAPVAASDSMILREAVRAGVGKALLPMCLAENEPQLKRIGSGEPDLVRPLQMHVHPDIVQFTRVQGLINALRANFQTIFGRADAI